MLRTTSTVVVALLVLASGATVGLAAASQAPADVSSTPLAQDNETAGNDTAENETMDDGEAMSNDTADNATADDETTGEETGNATVAFLNQTTNGSAVLVNETTLPEGGYVVIHLANVTGPDNVSVGAVVGNSSYLDAGVHENLTVAIAENETLEESQWLVAMPHLDTDDDQVYEFPEADDPYTIDGAPVIDEAYVEVSADAGAIEVTGERTVAVENVTVENETADGEEPMGNETMDGADNETMDGDDEAMGNETMGNETMGNESA